MAAVAGTYRDAGDDLSATVPDPDVVEFFDFVRTRLEQARRSGSHAASIGGDANPAREAIRFGAAVGQRYVADEIVAARDTPAGRRDIAVAFMGLTGPTAVLPDHYSEQVIDRRRERDPALADFLDLFNHRALSHFWRAWAKYRLPVAFEADAGRLGDPFSRALKALAGLGVAGEAVPDEAVLAAAGAMARRVRSAGALRRLISGIYNLPVRVIELDGRWVRLNADDQTRLHAGNDDRPAFDALGVDTVVGAAVWDVGSRFRVRIGPLGFDVFRSFFAANGPRAAINDTIRRAVGGNVDFTLQLVLRAADVPMLRLDDPATPAALGQSTWLLAGASRSDRDEATLASDAPIATIG